jgi:hypothetical protein
MGLEAATESLGRRGTRLYAGNVGSEADQAGLGELEPGGGKVCDVAGVPIKRGLGPALSGDV